MNRVSVIAVWIVVIVTSAFVLYRVKYEVQSIRAQIVETNQQLAQEKETLHVVAAEWAYLNRPERLRELANKYLVDEQLTVAQIAEVEAIPFPTQMQAAADVDEDNNHIMPANYSQAAYTKGSIIP